MPVHLLFFCDHFRVSQSKVLFNFEYTTEVLHSKRHILVYFYTGLVIIRILKNPFVHLFTFKETLVVKISFISIWNTFKSTETSYTYLNREQLSNGRGGGWTCTGLGASPLKVNLHLEQNCMIMYVFFWRADFRIFHLKFMFIVPKKDSASLAIISILILILLWTKSSWAKLTILVYISTYL